LAGEGRFSNHLPILLQIDKDDQKPPRPFKFNHKRLEDEGLTNMVMKNWKMFEPKTRETMMYRFVINLNNVKKIAVEWE